VRAFLAIPVTPPALDDGVRLLNRLRDSLPTVRWVRPEGLHLTLHFFENLPKDQADTVLDAVHAGIADTPPFEAQLAGLGCFPRDGDEHVLWIGMQLGSPQAAALQAVVARHLEGIGHEPERRAFHPHVTLGRPRRRFDESTRRRWRRFADSELPPFTVGEVRLYRSHMGDGGSRYEVLATIPLRGASGAAL
jgi:RNA 2',3'-cyclic 3'-phosphodiesterase